jgi:hypothetical protein
MNLLARHIILVAGESKEECKSQVLNFFDKTSLLHYDRIVVDESRQLSARDNEFSIALEKALDRNRQILSELVDELGAAGFTKRSDLPDLAQGYPSKVLHIIAHFLDGFIGIDTVFYNLVNDSHWLPGETAARILEEPERFWLVSLDGYSMSPREAALLHM